MSRIQLRDLVERMNLIPIYTYLTWIKPEEYVVKLNINGSYIKGRGNDVGVSVGASTMDTSVLFWKLTLF